MKTHLPEKKIVHWYTVQNISASEIARRLNTDPWNITRRLHSLGVELKYRGGKDKKKTFSEKDLVRWYTVEHLSAQEIAHRLKTGRWNIERRLKELGVKIHHVGSKEVDPKWARRRFLGEKASLDEMAKELGCSRKQMERKIRLLGLHRGSILKGVPKTKDHRIKIGKAHLGKKRSASHVKKLKMIRGSRHSRWKGGFTKKSGYVFVWTEQDGKTIYRPEHRVVMENHLGRPLKRFENVHHRNGIRSDNRLENLELWASCQPSGQRVSDLLSFVVQHYRSELEELLSSSA